MLIADQDRSARQDNSPPSSVGRARGTLPLGRGFEPHGGCFLRASATWVFSGFRVQANAFHACELCLPLFRGIGGDEINGLLFSVAFNSKSAAVWWLVCLPATRVTRAQISAELFRFNAHVKRGLSVCPQGN